MGKLSFENFFKVHVSKMASCFILLDKNYEDIMQNQT